MIQEKEEDDGSRAIKDSLQCFMTYLDLTEEDSVGPAAREARVDVPDGDEEP